MKLKSLSSVIMNPYCNNRICSTIGVMPQKKLNLGYIMLCLEQQHNIFSCKKCVN